MSPARPLLRLRAAGLVLTCVALAAGTTFHKASAPAPPAGKPDAVAVKVVEAARAQVGDDYVWGGNGPDAWDCSGFTSLWKTVGGATAMPRVSRDQQAWTVPIPREQLLAGDLVFFGHPVTHTGIYIGAGRMVDAAQSKKGVVERAVWTTGVVRYGRVPRPGMPRVTPWTPPPLPPAQPSAPVADSPQAAAAAPKASRSRETAPRPPEALPRLQGLPAKQKRVSSLVAYKAAAKARTFAGQRAGDKGWDDVGLVHVAWRSAGGGNLPGSRDVLVARGKRVKLSDARIGDLVVYSRPDTPHLGIYLGGGMMVDASPKQGKVVIRPVYAASSVRLVRLG